jgi:hypothetical protein
MATTSRSLRANWRTVLFVLVVASLACAPVSWVDDGLTPSWIIYPLILLVGLWRMWRGHGTLYFGIAGTIFLLVHLPFTWAALFGSQSPVGLTSRTTPCSGSSRCSSCRYQQSSLAFWLGERRGNAR